VETTPEPWLRGPIEGVHPLVSPILYAFQQAREDLAKWTESLSTEQIWATPHGFGSVGFHILHIAGSIDRLISYLQGRQLTPEQMRALGNERAPEKIGRADLFGLLNSSLEDAERVVRAIDPATLPEARFVGRKRLPTTVIGLLTHIAEHTQRHVGQAISAARWTVVSVPE
jgi:uncharacterized damage-inducible protein DinB